MLEIHLDNVLIDENAYESVQKDGKIYSNSFYAGGIATTNFKVSLIKDFVQSQPSEVVIVDKYSTYVLDVDKIVEDDFLYHYDLVDKMNRFNFKYSAEDLINDNRDEDGNSTTTIQDILDDMCYKAGVECNYTIQTTNHIVDWWDDRIFARDYISYIAEKEGGFARIENDELVIIPFGQTSKYTINEEDSENLYVGEKIEISRVVYDMGANKWEYGNENNQTLYVSPNNPFIVEEEDIENIYNIVNGFTFYSISVDDALVDGEVLTGDIITFTDSSENLKPTIAQFDLSYVGDDWFGSYALDLDSIAIQETNILGISESVKSIRTEVDRTNASISLIAEETSTLQSDMLETTNTVLAQQTDIDNLSERTDDLEDEHGVLKETTDTLADRVGELDNAINEVDEEDETAGGIKQQISYISNRQNQVDITIDGLKQSQSYSGGYNLIENCVKQFGNAGWELLDGNAFNNITTTEIKENSLTKSALMFQVGKEQRVIQTENRIHNFSFKYKKLSELSSPTITINETVLDLDVYDEWTVVEVNLEVTDNTVEIFFESDGADSLLLVDPLLIPGNIRQIWTPNPNEIHTGVIKLGGDTLSIDSNQGSTKFEATTDGTRVKNRNTDEVVAEFTAQGVWTEHIEGNSGEIAKVSFIDVGNQTWLVRR